MAGRYQPYNSQQYQQYQQNNHSKRSNGPRGSRFFLAKSMNDFNISVSQHYGLWFVDTQRHGERTLQEMQKLLRNPNDGPVHMIFTVMGSQKFQGFARMTSALGSTEYNDWQLDDDVSHSAHSSRQSSRRSSQQSVQQSQIDVSCSLKQKDEGTIFPAETKSIMQDQSSEVLLKQDRKLLSFKVEWINRTAVDYSLTKHLRNRFNRKQVPICYSYDLQEVSCEEATALCLMFPRKFASGHWAVPDHEIPHVVDQQNQRQAVLTEAERRNGHLPADYGARVGEGPLLPNYGWDYQPSQQASQAGGGRAFHHNPQHVAYDQLVTEVMKERNMSIEQLNVYHPAQANNLTGDKLITQGGSDKSIVRGAGGGITTDRFRRNMDTKIQQGLVSQQDRNNLVIRRQRTGMAGASSPSVHSKWAQQGSQTASVSNLSISGADTIIVDHHDRIFQANGGSRKVNINHRDDERWTTASVFGSVTAQSEITTNTNSANNALLKKAPFYKRESNYVTRAENSWTNVTPVEEQKVVAVDQLELVSADQLDDIYNNCY